MGANALRDRFFGVVNSSAGLSLVEVIISLVVLLFTFMGLLLSALLSIDQNVTNLLREEAVSIAAMRMEQAMNMSFGDVKDDAAGDPDYNPVPLPFCGNPPVNDAGPYPVKVERNIRNMGNFQFGTRRTTIDPLPAPHITDPDTIKITVLVRWQYKGECSTHSITSLRRRS
jgi:type II secretory pathway pseudopilin PulG